MKIVIAEKYAYLSDFIRSLPAGTTPPDEVIRDYRNILTKVKVDGKVYVVKQYVRPRFYNRIAYTFFRKSKARRSYEYALELIRRGIGTAEPVAYIEIRQGGLFHTGFFVSEFIDEPLLSTIGERPDKEQLLDEFAQFTADLHTQGIVHHDYNPHNVLFRPENGGYHFWLIDINRMSFHRSLSKRQCLDGMKRIGFEFPILTNYVYLYALKRDWHPEYTLGTFFTLRENFLKRPRRKQARKLKK